MVSLLTRWFDPAVAARGARYFQNGAVKVSHWTERRIDALVRGSETYAAGLCHSGDNGQATLCLWCNCPFVIGHDEPFLLRRTKREVARELPDRIEQNVFIELRGRERQQYDELLKHFRRRIDKQVASVGLARSTPQVLEALLRLRQAACHPGLLDAGRKAERSAKLDRALDEIERIRELGERCLVFSQFTTFLGVLRQRLEQKGIGYEYLDGRSRQRHQIVERFQRPDGPPVFLISLLAGGVGLNLTAAEHVLLLDPWWNPAVEAQAIDRTHRIGQTRTVLAHRFIARGTVEEKVLALQNTKRALAQAILGQDAGLGGKLTREDLESILS